MLTWILAHGSGIDELFIFGWPVIVGIGFWFIALPVSGAPPVNCLSRSMAHCP